MKKLILLSALSAAGSAQAQLSYSGGSLLSFSDYNAAGTGDGSNVDTIAQDTGWLDATIDTGDGGQLTATYFGEAAGNDNSFWVNGSQRFSNSSTAVGTSTTVAVAAGPLDWFFKDLSGAPRAADTAPHDAPPNQAGHEAGFLRQAASRRFTRCT